MMCANWDDDHLLSFDLEDGNPRRNNDVDIVPLINSEGVTRWGNVQDGRLTFTPRGIILAASYGCADEGECDFLFYSRVKWCPYEDMKIFLPCLKCQGVKSDDIEKFDKYIQGKRFGSGYYSVPRDLMDWNGIMRRGICWDENGNHFELVADDSYISAEAVETEERPYDYTFTMTGTYPTSIAPTDKPTDVELEDHKSTGTPRRDDDQVRSKTEDVLAGTTTVQRSKPSQTGNSKNNARGQALPELGILGTLLVTIVLL
ncbi:hypothetical protein HG530_015154 [Fusarium avenaceum]|nr:hypothetical protein HG530_015154 [Fusarium avenaceum]